MKTKTRTFKGYDIIGDVHGCHLELTRLLTAMGYRQREGVWRHRSRLAVFVGDLVDRGPEIEDVLETVAAMVDAGAAECILGNHERDLIYWHTLNKKGRPIREHDKGRAEQLKATHDQLGMKSRAIRKWVAWLRTRPILFERAGLRVVHGAWNENAANFWRGKTLADSALLEQLADKHSKPSSYLGRLLFGPVIAFKGQDKEGKPKTHNIRARWYVRPTELAAPTLWHAAFQRRKRWPHNPLTAEESKLLWGYPRNAPPVITGHQSLPIKAPLRPLRPNVGCVDYSAVYGGRLCAYRWSGEARLLTENFVAVPARPRKRKRRTSKPATTSSAASSSAASPVTTKQLKAA